MVKKKYKYDIIADKIMEKISDGDYLPGDKLPPEAELIKLYEVSRVTLRESLKKLSMLGVVTINQGDGTYVNKITPSSFMEPLFPLLVLNCESVEEIYNARIYLEGGISELAAIYRTEEDLEIMNHILEEMENAIEIDDYSTFSKCDRKFHQAIENACRNEVLCMISKLFNRFLEIYLKRINVSKNIVENSINEHRQLYHAIQNKRGELAGITMREHLREAKNNLLKSLKIPLKDKD